MSVNRRPGIRHRAKGFALIAVVWLLALLTLLATSAALLSVTHRRAVEAFAATVHLDALCDSAIRVTLLGLIAPQSPSQRMPIGAPVSVTVPFGTAQVTIERDAGKIDLNTAEDALIFALFAANGWKESDARSMADRIADWKDGDDDPRENGAERAQYAAAEIAYGPRNGPFATVEELRQVLGAQAIPPELLRAFTVYTHAARPLVTAAVPQVKRALLYADSHQLDGHRWLSHPEDDDGPTDEHPTTTPEPDSTANTQSLAGEVLTLTSCATFRGTGRCRSSVLRLTGNVHKPLQMFVWQVQLPQP
jgi:general secretion pathway protein K